MSQGWMIRLAQPDDLTAVEEIEADSFVKGVRESRATFAERMAVFPEGFLLAVEADTHQLAGYITTEIWPEHIKPTQESLRTDHSIAKLHDSNGTTLYISSIAISPNFRGLGLGEKLLRWIIENTRNNYSLERAILVVCEDWENARRLYKRCGFKEVGKLEKVYAVDERELKPGILMEFVF